MARSSFDGFTQPRRDGGGITGKRTASGITGSVTTTFSITGLSFAPSRVMYYPIGANAGVLYAVGIANIDNDIYTGDGISKNVYMRMTNASTFNAVRGTPTFNSSGVSNLAVDTNPAVYKWIAYE